MAKRDPVVTTEYCPSIYVSGPLAHGSDASNQPVPRFCAAGPCIAITQTIQWAALQLNMSLDAWQNPYQHPFIHDRKLTSG